MKERPILFLGPMVRAILAGQKTMTRRILKYQEVDGVKLVKLRDRKHVVYLDKGHTPGLSWVPAAGDGELSWHPQHDACPYGGPGDRLWVRETWCRAADPCDYLIHGEPGAWRPRGPNGEWAYYAASEDVDDSNGSPWKPSIFMPRWASRILLEITDVRLEHLHSITEADAKAEGIDAADGEIDDALICKIGKEAGWGMEDYRSSFGALWCQINGVDSWAANPYVWVISFKKVEGRAP